jgi:hypothetical protein
MPPSPPPDLQAAIEPAAWLEALRRRVKDIRTALEALKSEPVHGLRFEVGGVPVKAQWASGLVNVTIGDAALEDASTNPNAYSFIVPLKWVTDEWAEADVTAILSE